MVGEKVVGTVGEVAVVGAKVVVAGVEFVRAE